MIFRKGKMSIRRGDIQISEGETRREGGAKSKRGVVNREKGRKSRRGAGLREASLISVYPNAYETITKGHFLDHSEKTTTKSNFLEIQ